MLGAPEANRRQEIIFFGHDFTVGVLNAICVRLASEPPGSDHSSSGSHQLCHACLQFREFIGVGIVSVLQLKFSGLEFLDHGWPSLIHRLLERSEIQEALLQLYTWVFR